MKKSYCVICGKYRIEHLLEKTLVFSIIFINCKNEYEKLFKEEASIEILKILDLIENI